MSISLILTCEHAKNHIPEEYQHLFLGQKKQLVSHEGYDIGALECAQFFQEKLQVPLFQGEVSRLLVDLNRSIKSRSLFTQKIKNLDPQKKSKILDQFYHPYQQKVIASIQEMQQKGFPVLHLSFHSFTHVFKGVERDADIGFLYDHSRIDEKRFCHLFRFHLLLLAPFLRVRKNYPYQGDSDGVTTSLREEFSRYQYMGIELEINQNHPLGDVERWKKLQTHLYEAFQNTLTSFKNK